MLRVATDIGGTFTDLVFVTPDGEVVTGKSHTTPAQFEKGVMDVISASGTTPSEFASFVHGTTIVINAITERKGAKVGLLTSEGFRDILEIGRGTRPDFFNLEYRKPEPFVPRYLRREVKGRINYKGIEATPLDLAGLPAILSDFRAEGVEAVAICFINSYANPAHEEAALAYGLSLPASALAHELFGAMQAQGWGRLDHSAVMRVIELLSDVEVRTAVPSQ